ISRDDLENAILHHARQPSTLSRLEAQRIFDSYINGLPIYWRWVWFFLIDDTITTADDLSSNSCLPWRLGLDRVTTGSQYFAMMFNSSACSDVRKPCVADVDFGYHDLWRPGGATIPRSDTPAICDRTPCNEIVASPPTFGNVTQFTLVAAR